SLILMVGAAGRGTGIDVAFLVPFFVWTLGLPDSDAGLSIAAGLLTVMNFAALVGPFAVAYFFDRYNQRVVLAVTLVLSSVATLAFVVVGCTYIAGTLLVAFVKPEPKTLVGAS